jgi:tripartite-type tricarboxylate transporter receptor subunit TctC
MATNEADRLLLRYGMLLPRYYQRLYFMAPEVPADRYAAMADAWTKTLTDRDLLADMAQAGLVVQAVPGAQVKQIVTDQIGMPAAVKERLAALPRD